MYHKFGLYTDFIYTPIEDANQLGVKSSFFHDTKVYGFIIQHKDLFDLTCIYINYPRNIFLHYNPNRISTIPDDDKKLFKIAGIPDGDKFITPTFIPGNYWKSVPNKFQEKSQTCDCGLYAVYFLLYALDYKGSDEVLKYFKNTDITEDIIMSYLNSLLPTPIPTSPSPTTGGELEKPISKTKRKINTTKKGTKRRHVKKRRTKRRNVKKE